MRRMIIVVTAVCVWPLVAATAAIPDLAGVDLELVEIADSGDYFLYAYELRNPSASTWGLAAIEMRIPASSGTPATLVTTGDVVDYTTSGGSVDPHAEVGPIVPGGWTAYLDRGAGLMWALPSGIRKSFDSLAPGETRDSIGIRSSYLPGLTEVSAYPTMQSCCAEPYDSTPNDERYYTPSSFGVSGTSVAPRYMPDEVDLDVLETQIDAVCDDPLWIDDVSLCDELADSLDVAQARDAINNHLGVLSAIEGVQDTVVHIPQAIDSNAYYMILRNAGQVIANVNEPSPPAWPTSTLCAAGSAGGTAYFTVTADQDSLWVSAPLALDIEEDGVDPPGSSCTTVWQMAPEVTSLADVTVVLDSLSPGLEVVFVGTLGGLDGYTTVQGDTVTMRHDGETEGKSHWIVDPS